MLTPITDNIWSVGAELKMWWGFKLPLRATIVRLESGELWVHSPVETSPEDHKAIAKLGAVTTITAPNAMHHLQLEEFAKHWPDATIIGPASLLKKRPDIPFDATIEEHLANNAPWTQEFQTTHIDGVPDMDETIFFHTPTNSLLVTDLIFNMPKAPSFVMKLILSLSKAIPDVAHSRLWTWLAKDQQALANSLQQVLQYPAERIIPCHGNTFEDTPEKIHHQLQSAFAHTLAKQQKQLK